MKEILVLMMVVLGIVLYRSRSRNHLDVTPEAHREIERAKGR